MSKTKENTEGVQISDDSIRDVFSKLKMGGPDMADRNLVKVDIIAKIFQVTVRRVQQLTQESIIQTVEVAEGNRTVRRYDLMPTIMQYIKYLSDKANGREQKVSITDKEEEKLQAEVDIKKAKAKIAQLELDELEGRMHSADDVEAMTTDLCLAVRSALLSMPGQLAVDVADLSSAAEISEVIKTTVNDILEELSRYEYNPDEYRRRVRERQGWLESRSDDEYDEE